MQTASRLVGPLKALGFLLLIIALFYLAIIQLRHIFFHTSYFELKTVEVTGNIRLDKEETVTAAGVAPAQNVLLLDREAARQRLLMHPVIKEAKVELVGLHHLKLSILERTPFMYAKVGTTFYEIDEDGIVLHTEGLGDLDLPIVTGLSLEASQDGDSLKNHDGFFMAQNWIKKLEPEILKNISEINFSSHQSPYLFLITGEKVYPSGLDDFKNRYLFLRALLDNLRKNNVEPIYLDMRAPSESVIVVRPKNKKGVIKESGDSIAGG